MSSICLSSPPVNCAGLETSSWVFLAKKQGPYYQDYATLYGIGTDYIEIHNTETANISLSHLWMGQCYSDLTGIYEIYRGPLFFDTQYIIPDHATTLNATLSLRLLQDTSSVDFNITIQQGSANHPNFPYELGDYYHAFYSGNGGTFDTTNLQGGWNNISLNTQGLNWINTITTTKLVLRSDKDINAEQPSSLMELVAFYMSDPSHVDNDAYRPKLYVTYQWEPKEDENSEWYVPPPEEKPPMDQISEVVEPIVRPLEKYGLYLILGVMGLLVVGGIATSVTKKKASTKPRGLTNSKPKGPTGKFKAYKPKRRRS